MTEADYSYFFEFYNNFDPEFIVKHFPDHVKNFFSWDERRKKIGAVQSFLKEKSIDCGPVDGYLGPRTLFGISAYLASSTLISRPDDVLIANVEVDNPWPSAGQTELIEFYGNPNHSKFRNNLVYAKLPYKHVLAWNQSIEVTRVTCHKFIKDSYETILAQVLDHYGEEEIIRLGLHLFGGCHNHRNKRGGSTLSTHAFGIAVDYDPGRNQLKWRKDKAEFAKPDYEAWWQIWEAHGWTSLGRKKDFDWMHIQAANL